MRISVGDWYPQWYCFIASRAFGLTISITEPERKGRQASVPNWDRPLHD
jgi:hypothetical protein